MALTVRQRLRSHVMRPGRVARIPVGVAAGLRLEVDPAAPVHVYAGTAEAELGPHLRRLVRPGLRCFDIGGHNAFYALVLARLSGEPVVSFEFDPAGLERMARNLAHNPDLAPRVTVRPAYLAELTDAAAGTWTLDDVIAHDGLRVPGFIKMDVEGAEARVLQGASGVLRTRPHLIIETHGAAVEASCAELLTAAGYRPRIVTQRARLREHRAPDNRWLVAQGAPLGAPAPA